MSDSRNKKLKRNEEEEDEETRDFESSDSLQSLEDIEDNYEEDVGDDVQDGSKFLMFNPSNYNFYSKIPLKSASLSFQIFDSSKLFNENDNQNINDDTKNTFVTELISANGIGGKSKSLCNQHVILHRVKTIEKINPVNDDCREDNNSRKFDELQSTDKLKSCDYTEENIMKLDDNVAINRMHCAYNSNRLLLALMQDNCHLNLTVFKNSQKHRSSNLEENLSLKFKSYKLNCKSEGFAVRFSNKCETLAFGNNSGDISIVEINESLMKNCIISPQDNASRGIFRHHKSSVEDIQWHPNSENIFASCSSDRSISIWDKREFMSRSSSNYRNLHQKDINVISWHQNNCNYILSGSDDCLIKLWDLRKIDMDDQSKPQACLKTFLWHSDSIQSLEWSPNDPNLFAACSSDDTLTLWDLYWSDDSDNKQSGDEKEGAKNKKKKSKQKIASEPPKELFFDHRSLNQVKELHWIKDRETEKSNGEIPNATGTLVSIDINGYDIFSPIDS